MLVEDLTLQILCYVLPDFGANRVHLSKTQRRKENNRQRNKTGRRISVYDPDFSSIHVQKPLMNGVLELGKITISVSCKFHLLPKKGSEVL